MLIRTPAARRLILVSVLVLAALATFPSASGAQYFGRNKVRWEDFDWKVLKTEHFDIYHYPEEERAVRDAGRMAERWYARLSSVFGRELRERKAIVLYADHSDFQQTSVIGGLISQGTGGVTEGMKTRVVLPLTGNYEETDHVLGHELVHVFQYDILKEPRDGGAGAQPVGAGPVVTYPISRVRGRKLQSGRGFLGGYFLSGGTLMASATRRFPLSAGFFLSLDGRVSATYVRVPVADGHASVPNLALHLHAGLGYQHEPSQARPEESAP